MTEVPLLSDSIEDRLAAAVMKASQAHMLLTGIVDRALHPPVKELATASLTLLDEAVWELRDVVGTLKAGG